MMNSEKPRQLKTYSYKQYWGSLLGIFLLGLLLGVLLLASEYSSQEEKKEFVFYCTDTISGTCEFSNEDYSFTVSTWGSVKITYD